MQTIKIKNKTFNQKTVKLNMFMDENKIVTVIIVNWNTKDDLLNCIRSLKDNILKNKTDIIVVDNASSDCSVQALVSVFPDVKIINSGANIGFGRANNIGLKEVKTEYTLFLNPDTIVEYDSISKMVEVLRLDIHTGAVGCKMKYPDGRVQPLGLQWFPTPFTEFVTLLFITANTIKIFKRLLPYQDPLVSSYVNKLYGGCILVRTALLRNIGGFDDVFFMYGEDVDLCRKILNANYKLFYCAEAEIIHLCGRASKKAPSSFSIIMKCESINKLMLKYYGFMGALLYRKLNFAGALFRILITITISPFLFLSNKKNILYSILKNYYIILWATGLKKSSFD